MPMNPFRIIVYLALLGTIVWAANQTPMNTRLAAFAVAGIFIVWILAWIAKHYGGNK